MVSEADIEELLNSCGVQEGPFIPTLVAFTNEASYYRIASHDCEQCSGGPHRYEYDFDMDCVAVIHNYKSLMS